MTLRSAMSRVGRSGRSSVLPLLRSAHIGPGMATTSLTALLTAADRLPATTAARAVGAVFLGQLSIGWGNDLVDAARDTAVHRADKPIASGTVEKRAVATGLVASLVGCAGMSASLGRRSATAHLACGVAPAHAYNVWLKATAYSWLPYAVAFGALPSVVSEAGHGRAAPIWVTVPAAALGVCAHILNTLPDLGHDDATGVRGLPHRLGERRGQQVATALAASASTVLVVGAPGAPTPLGWTALGVVGILSLAALTGSGQTPFRAAVVIAMLDAGLLVASRR